VELSLGRRADYAIRATLDLAQHLDRLRKSREIGEAMNIPVSYLPQILAQLVRVGIATSTAGPNGGYGLARDPAAISLLDVIEAVDGEVAATACVLRGGPCRWEDMCAVHLPWAQAQRALTGELAGTSFTEVVALDAALAAGELEELPPELRRVLPATATLEDPEPAA
jgi:Rrf2 family transcriptional regulator, iron-sulfur cluster assembly transcription factor